MASHPEAKDRPVANAPIHRPHSRDIDEVYAQLTTTPEGLATPDAALRRKVAGPNTLPDPPRTHPVVRFLAQFNNVIIYVLLVSAVVKLIFRDYVDFGVIIAVAVIIAIIGFVQEGQAEKALRGIRNMLSLRATVRRDGAWHDLDAAELVPGDTVLLAAGDRAPADTRLREARDVRVDEAALTGEAVAVDKHNRTLPDDTPIGDRANMLHAGSVVVAGRAVGIVTATGTGTELGRIQQLVRDVDQTQTPLISQINRLGVQITLFVLVSTAAMMLIGWLLHREDLEFLASAGIGYAVAAIPEGLPAVVTITLALGVRQMARQRAITRKLTAVETLGSVSTICTDKTGTLTMNEMTVRSACTAAGAFTVTGDGYCPAGEIQTEDGFDVSPGADLSALATALSVCNDARLEDHDGAWSVVGDPTEGALVAFGRKVGVDSRRYTRTDEIPFDSTAKYMATLDEDADGIRTIFVKGAADVLLARCRTGIAPDGSEAPLDVAEWTSIIATLSDRGMRVLAAAGRAADPDSATVEPGHLHDLVFFGLVAISDPPRPEAVTAITELHAAGVGVKMITGDHARTAHAIATEIGISEAEDASLTGRELDALDDEQLQEAVARVDVFARTSPEHKIRIISALQARGQIFAMTGDGVNDAPALARADVGVAMGVKGTEAAKDAADIVLADDNFATIERAVRQGRRIYDNIQKSLLFILPTTFGQAIVIFVAVVVGFEPPLQPTQILWVNLVTAVTLSLAFAYEPVEPGTMRRPPRPPGRSILSGHIVQVLAIIALVGAATIAAYFWEVGRGADPASASTTAVTVLVLTQVAVMFNVRFLRQSSLTWRVFQGNRAMWTSLGVLAVLQLAYTYLPPFHLWFGSTPLGPAQWGIAFAFAAVVFLLGEVGKALGRMRQRPARRR